MIQEKTSLLDERLSAMQGTGSFVRLDQAYSAYLGDVTVELTVGGESRLLEEGDFAPEWYVHRSTPGHGVDGGRRRADSAKAQHHTQHPAGEPRDSEFPVSGQVSMIRWQRLVSTSTTEPAHPHRLLKLLPMGFMRRAYPRIAAFKMWDVVRATRSTRQ